MTRNNSQLGIKPIKWPKGGLLGMSEGNQKRKRRPIDKNVKSVLWQKYFKNSMVGKCYVCKRPVTNDNFDAGHNKASAKGGSDKISNLRPICRPCNSSMGTMSIEQYKTRHFGKPISKKTTNRKNTKRKKKRSNDSFRLFNLPRSTGKNPFSL